VARPLLLALAALALLAGCGGGDPPSAESVVRAWSQSLNAGDDEAAAELFAEGARVVRPNGSFRLHTERDAVRFNESLPCSGTITDLTAEGDTVRATFLLGDREESRCDGPGQRVRALFRVRDGKIVLWHQLDAGEDDVDTI
jgi:ketosteroid isomerase-like protein